MLFYYLNRRYSILMAFPTLRLLGVTRLYEPIHHLTLAFTDLYTIRFCNWIIYKL